MAATHQRQKIREAAKAALLGRTAAGERVFTTRMLPYEGPASLPAIAIYAITESVDPESRATAPRELTRELQLAVEASVAEGAGNLDDELDAIAREVEALLHVDPTFGDTCVDSLLASTRIGVDEDGEHAIGVAVLTFAVTYRTYAPEAEDVPLKDLAKVHTKTSLGATQAPADQAEDRVTLPTT